MPVLSMLDTPDKTNERPSRLLAPGKEVLDAMATYATLYKLDLLQGGISGHGI